LFLRERPGQSSVYLCVNVSREKRSRPVRAQSRAREEGIGRIAR